MATSFHISLPDPARARASGPFAFTSQGADGMARELEDALRKPDLFERWRLSQDDPDAIDPALGATDPEARVTGQPHDLHVDLLATTSIAGALFKHRLRLLAGSTWELRNVTAA